ncbi:MAG: LptM family lipoprotein, partial [Ostreibacterium sp.]
MKKAFRTFFSLSILFALGCGQKGPLYLGKKTSKPLLPTATINNSDTKIIPEVLQLDDIMISGQSIQLSQNTTVGWQTVLNADKNNGNLIRYWVFSHSITTSTTKNLENIDILIGNIQNKIIKGQTRQTIAAGEYLRFRSLSKDGSQIPTLISRAKDYLNNNKALKHGKNKDFIMENQKFIDLYLS